MLDLSKAAGFQNFEIQAHKLLYEAYTALGENNLANEHLMIYAKKRDELFAQKDVEGDFHCWNFLGWENAKTFF